MTLKPVYTVLERIGSVSSRKEKERLLEEGLQEIGDDLYDTILYALDAYRQFNVTKVEFLPDAPPSTPKDIFSALDQLTLKRAATDKDKEFLSLRSSIDEETVEVVRRIINKDLRCGVGVKTAAKFVSGVKEYGVMKPQTDKKNLLKDWDKFVQLAGGCDNICWSVKVDGVRICDCVVHRNGDVEYFSTNGKKYRNFHCFNETMTILAETLNTQFGVSYPVRFDGEVISYDGNFQSVVTQTQRDNDVDTSNLRFLVWSVVCEGPFRERHNLVKTYLPVIRRPLREQYLLGPTAIANVFCLNHVFEHSIKSWKDAEVLSRQIISDGEEGVIFKVSDHEHVRKRSRLWFRTKAMYLEGTGVEVDLKVLRAEKGTGKFKDKMGCLVCDYNGQEVRVGGGYTEKQREEFLTRTPSWITVSADSETNDHSLRFPQFIREREEK